MPESWADRRGLGGVLKNFLEFVSDGTHTDWREAPPDLRERATLLTGNKAKSIVRRCAPLGSTSLCARSSPHT